MATAPRGPAAAVPRARCPAPLQLAAVRVIIATCSVDYDGRLSAHLPLATRLLMVKADGSVLDPRRRPRLQAAQLDEPAVPLEEAPGRLGGQQPGEELRSRWRRSSRTRRTSSGSTRACERWRRGAPAGAAGGAPTGARRGDVAGPARVPDRDRPGRPDVPRRRGAQRRGRDQAARGHRRRRAADPLPGAAQPRSAAGPGPGSSPPRRSSPRPGCWPQDRGIRCVVVDYEPCAAPTTAPCACSDPPGWPGGPPDERKAGHPRSSRQLPAASLSGPPRRPVGPARGPPRGLVQHAAPVADVAPGYGLAE